MHIRGVSEAALQIREVVYDNVYISPVEQQPLVDHGLLIIETHPSRHDSSGRVISATQKPLFIFNKTNRRTNFPNLFLSRNSACFGQFLRRSSGVFHCTFGTGICHQTCMTYQCRMYCGKLMMMGKGTARNM
jgi:hypothetical protein